MDIASTFTLYGYVSVSIGPWILKVPVIGEFISGPYVVVLIVDSDNGTEATDDEFGDVVFDLSDDSGFANSASNLLLFSE
ncbi:MAG: hypothetical protein P0116_16365 [Candidatus Nitrosocosmicus sp.]|nr:hypothetical protein [Candidatus Nitrosocosmicus sp.]